MCLRFFPLQHAGSHSAAWGWGIIAGEKGKEGQGLVASRTSTQPVPEYPQSLKYEEEKSSSLFTCRVPGLTRVGP